VPLYSYNGQLFQVNGLLAANENCCCDNCPGNSCCFMSECLDLPQEYCDLLNAAVAPGCPANFTPCVKCTEESCECDDTEEVNCCIDGYCTSGEGITECTCILAGGCVLSDCEDCEPNPDPCDYEDETPVGTSGFGVMCLPDGTCVDITTEGERCLYAFAGGLFIDGVACIDDPCPEVPPLDSCDPSWSSCCCLVNTITYLRVRNDGSPCPSGSAFACNWDNTIDYTSTWTVQAGPCSSSGSVTPSLFRSPTGCGYSTFDQLVVVTRQNVDCANSGLCSNSDVVFSYVDNNDCDFYYLTTNTYTVSPPFGCP